MRLRSRFLGISVFLALAGLLASFGAGCVCGSSLGGHSGAAMAAMPGMSMAHCHAEGVGPRFTSPCCCEVSPEVPPAAESFRASSLPERPTLTAELPNVALAAAPERRDEHLVLDRRIDRAPPPEFGSPLRI